MKVVFAICTIVFILISCEDPTYTYFEKDTLYKFIKGDTLIYKNSKNSDTVIIKSVAYDFYVSDNIHHYQVLRVVNFPLNIVYLDTIFDSEIEIVRSLSSSMIHFRNFSEDIYNKSETSDYTIGALNIPNVYSSKAILKNNAAENSIKTIFYSLNFGIIAYILKNDELYELDVNCLKKRLK